MSDRSLLEWNRMLRNAPNDEVFVVKMNAAYRRAVRRILNPPHPVQPRTLSTLPDSPFSPHMNSLEIAADWDIRP